MMKKSWMISRRTMLRGLGAALALPKLEIMGASNASSAPKRMVSIFHPNGVTPKDWDCTGVGSDFTLSPILSPLEKVRDHITVISGLSNKTTKGHVAMTGAFLTGCPLTKGGRNGISLDQKIANHIGTDTAFKSLVLGTEAPRQGAAAGLAISLASTVSWSSETTRISPEINPRVAFDRMFRDQSGAEAVEKARLRRSVVDLVLADAKDVRRKASALDQHKIDDYLESVRSVETQLERAMDPPERSWNPPTTPDENDFLRPDVGLPRDRSLHLKLMIDLIVLGLWTDSTRVATLMAAHGFSRQNFSFLNGVSGDHHGMSHHKGQTKSLGEYTRVSTWYAEQLAYLLERMKSIDEGGATLLDNSIVLYGSGMKDGNGHLRDNLPIVVAGGGQGTVKTGQHLAVDPQPLSNLLYTLAQKFDIEEDNFNNVSSTVIAGI